MTDPRIGTPEAQVGKDPAPEAVAQPAPPLPAELGAAADQIFGDALPLATEEP